MEQKTGRQQSPRVAIYTRVSTSDQNDELQLRESQDYATRQGWQIVETYQDIASGAKSCRPGLNRLIGRCHRKEIRLPMAWKLDRFGRSLVDCLNNIRILEDHGIRFIAVTQGLDTDQRNPASRFLLHVLEAAGEFERSLIRERTQAGRVRYQQDYKAGKVGKTVYSQSRRNLAIARPKKIFNHDRLIEMHQAGASFRTIAKQLGLMLGTVARTLQRRAKKYRSWNLER